MTRAELEQIAAAAAAEFGIPVAGYLAQIGAESAWDVNAVSPVGAMGLAQIMPSTIPDTGIAGSPFDPVTGLRMGASYMARIRHWLRAMDLPDDWPYVLASYNGGIGRVRTAVRDAGPDWLSRMPPETRAYVIKLAPSFKAAPLPPVAAIVALLLAFAWMMNR